LFVTQVRQLASAAAQDGTVDAAAVKFVRHQKTTMIELQRRAAEKSQQILEKQASLHRLPKQAFGAQGWHLCPCSNARQAYQLLESLRLSSLTPLADGCPQQHCC
jgi:hypothetical protein